MAFLTLQLVLMCSLLTAYETTTCDDPQKAHLPNGYKESGTFQRNPDLNFSCADAPASMLAQFDVGGPSFVIADNSLLCDEKTGKLYMEGEKPKMPIAVVCATTVSGGPTQHCPVTLEKDGETAVVFTATADNQLCPANTVQRTPEGILFKKFECSNTENWPTPGVPTYNLELLNGAKAVITGTFTVSCVDASTLSTTTTQKPVKEITPYLLTDILQIITGSNISRNDANYPYFFKVVEELNVNKFNETTRIHKVKLALTECKRAQDEKKIILPNECPIRPDPVYHQPIYIHLNVTRYNLTNTIRYESNTYDPNTPSSTPKP